MSSSSSLDTAVLDAAFGADTFETLKLEVPGAKVRLRPHAEGDHVHVRGYVPDAETGAAQELFDRKGISTHQSGDGLHVYGDPLSTTVEDWRWQHRHRVAVHLDVHLPPTLDVTAQTPGGEIDASDLAGTLNLTVMGGSLRAERLKGSLHARGSGGSLMVKDSSASSLDLQWSAGEVTLHNIASDATTLQARAAPTTVHDSTGPVELSVHGAPLDLEGVDGPCDARVQGGDALTYHGAPTHDVSLTSVGGPLQTHLPPTHAADLTLRGSQVDLDDAFSFKGKRTARLIEGTLNDGGPILHLRSVRGPATCHPQSPDQI